jgi:hypothetical protein
MVYKVRDEADIIEDNLRYHRAQGVDFFVVADTGSTDGTVEILERYEQAGLVRLERIGGGIHDMKRGGEAEITRIAGEMGADWIIHNDADEFWWPVTGSLKETLAAIEEPYGFVIAPRTEFAARPGDEPFAERMTVREARFVRPAKSAHRAHPQIALRGPHPIEIWVDRPETPYAGLVGKPVLRTRAEHLEEKPLELLIAPTFPVGVLHFPFRTFQQYRRRVEIARDNGQLDRNPAGREVRRAYEQDNLEEVYARLALDDEAVAQGIEAGWLVEDTDFRDYLRAAPDPIEGGDPPPGAGAWPDERRAAALDALRADAMYVLSRYLQTHAYRAQERRAAGADRRRLEGRLKRQTQALRHRTRRLNKIKSSLWWRLRPRLPRVRKRRRKGR